MKTAYLTGDTFRFKSILSCEGWRWNSEAKAWTMDVDSELTESQVIDRKVRRLPGIRNRGSFSVSFND